ncbi:phosphatase PAP2 family protein [Arthrobacter pigmenti]
MTRWNTPAGRFLVRLAARVAAWIGPRWAVLLILVVGGTVVTVMTAASAEIYDAVSESEDIASLDRPVLQAAIDLRTQWLNGAVTAFTDLGGKVIMPVLAAIATGILVYLRRSVAPLILMLVATAGSLVMTNVGKDSIGRMRPPLEAAVPPFSSSPSFPSGHTLNATVIAGVVAYILMLHLDSKWSRTVTIVVAAVFAAAMGLSRVYLGHHWLTDVVVAWTIGLAWLAVLITAHRLLFTLRNRRKKAP